MEKTKKRPNHKNLQSQETATRILTQAMRIFLAKGYHGTSIEDITQAAKLTKGALYWHFRSKEDLLKRIVGEYENRFLDGMIKAVNEVEGDILEKIEKYFRYNAAFAYYNRELCVSFDKLAAELVGAHHGIESEFRRIYRKYQKFLSNLIVQGKKEKVFKKEMDEDLSALVIIAFHVGILLQWSMNKNEIDGEAYMNTFKKIMLHGMME
ncbi:MAG TPA: TetR/AcrR family transcriptional regulator [Thermodesulfobacteriota bacterium]|jgi:AcrR family transcriptional regulator|nr:TetR/AcrR family transcriptional regulator [Thermodesulfobacteriota bacterium]